MTQPTYVPVAVAHAMYFAVCSPGMALDRFSTEMARFRWQHIALKLQAFKMQRLAYENRRRCDRLIHRTRAICTPVDG